jgi:hypothetical protein
LAVIVQIDRGRYGEVALDGLNVALAVHWPGPMVEGNGSVGAYIDQRADDKQTEALGAIFTGAAAGTWKEDVWAVRQRCVLCQNVAKPLVIGTALCKASFPC